MNLGYEEQYLQLLCEIMTKGTDIPDRTGTGCRSLFGEGIRVDLSKGFPLLTTKKMFYKNIFGELLWFLSGNSDLETLRHYQNKEVDAHTIWSDDFEKYKESAEISTEWEELGRIYGYQLRTTQQVSPDGSIVVHDQLTTLIDNIKAVKGDPNHPMARRLICTFWNPYDHTIGDKKMVCITCVPYRFSMSCTRW